MSVDAFHRDLRSIGDTVVVPGGVNTTVILGIDSICDPIIEKARKERNKILMYIGIGLLCLCLIIFAVWGISKAVNNDTDNTGDTTDTTGDDGTDDGTTSTLYTPDALDASLTYYADIEIENYGTITVKLDQNAAPITAANFVELAKEGFYDGLTFHRILEGFMMQGGDPDGDGTGGHTDEEGSELNITGEFSYNGYENALSHTAGAISMARGDDYDSASSQFFIVHTSDYISSLDGQYAVFGYVTEGMDIVDAICSATYTMDEDETIDAAEQPVITSITIREVNENESDTDGTVTE